MRRLLIAVLVVIVLVFIAIAAISLIDVNKYRPRIEAELQSKLGLPVTLGQMHLRIFPFAIRVDGFTLGEPPQFPSPHPFATASEVYARVSVFSLIGGQPTIKNLTLDNPQIELIKNPAGIWNFSQIGAKSAPAPAPTSAPAPAQKPGEAKAGPPPVPAFDQLKIVNGQVAVTDEKAKQPRTVYKNIDLTLSDFALGKEFHLDLAMHFPGTGKELLTFAGKGGPLQAGHTAAIPVSGHLSLQQISLKGLNSVTGGALPPNTEASISGNANLSSQNNVIACKGNLRLNNPVVQGAKMNYPIEAEYQLSLNQTNDQIQIQSGTITMGPTAISASGNIDTGKKPSILDMHVTTNNASLTELSRLASAFGTASNPNDQVKGDISANLTAKGPVNALQMQGTLSSKSIQAQDLVLTNLHANTTMNNGVVQLAPVTANVFGGQENGTITLDTKPAHPLCSVKTKLTGVDTNALLSAVSSIKNTLYGSLGADADLNFAVDAGPNLAKTLNGTLNVAVTNGRLKNVNILSELAKIGKFLNSAPMQAGTDTALQKLSGTIDVKNGVATTNNLVAALDAGSLSAKGSVNLVNEALDMHMTAVLGSGISKTVGGTGIGGFLNTALANNQGELVLPVIATGTLDHPILAPDVQQLAQMKLKHLLPTSGNPSQMTSGLVGSVLGGVLGQQNQDQKKQQQNPINSILNGLGKKKH